MIYTEIDEKWDNWGIVFWLALDKNEKLGRNEWISLLYQLQKGCKKRDILHSRYRLWCTAIFSVL